MRNLLLALLFLCALPQVMAEPQDDGKLAGTWQMCKPYQDGDVMKMRMLPFLKILNTDGSFSNLFMGMNKNSKAIITAYGSYKQTSDSTYVESIKRSASEEALSGKDNALNFKFKDEWLLITYVSTEGKKMWEVWKRVGMRPDVVLQNGGRLLYKPEKSKPEGEKNKNE